METRANYVAVGAFVVVLLLSAAGVLLWIIGSQFDVKVAYFHMSFAGSVSGLTKDSTVRYNGVPVGKVSDIAIDKDNPGHITVVVALDPGTVIRQDAVASLASQGLTGGLQSLFDKAPEVMEKLLGIEDQLHDILGGKNRAAIDETVENIRKVTAAVAAHSSDIEQILSNTADATKQIDALAKSADQVVQKAGGVVDHADAAVGHVDKLVGHADKLIGNVDGTVNDMRPGLRDFSQRGEKQLEQLIGNFNAFVIKVSRVVDELERDPGKFLFGDHNEGYKPK